MPKVIAAYREEKIDRDILPEMGKLGLLGPTIPEEYGGAGLGYVAYGLITREIERVDSGYRSAMSVQSSLVMYPIYAYGTEAQRKKYLPKLATGEMIGCFGLTEPDHGSDPGSMATRAEKVAGGYKLTGAKMWISNSPIADIAVVWAKARRRDPRLHRGARHQGFRDAEDRRQALAARLGHRRDRARRRGDPGRQSAAECEGPRRSVRLSQQCALRHCLGRDGRGRSSAGTRRGNIRSTASSSAGRSPPISSSRRSSPTCRPRSRSACTARCGSGACWKQGRAAPPAISLMKRNNCGKALDIARVARDMHGGNGIADEFHVMRVLSESRDGQHLRGHARHPRADPRPRADRHSGVFLIFPSPVTLPAGGER